MTVPPLLGQDNWGDPPPVLPQSSVLDAVELDPAKDLESRLHDVPDPELPHVTIGDLGIVRSVDVDGVGATVTIVLSPTYTGCPATEQIADDVAAVARAAGYEPRIELALAPAWSSDWITARGRQRLAAAGIAPPGRIVSCPRCGSQLVRSVSEFGSTACKAMYACQSCREPFERFKTI